MITDCPSNRRLPRGAVATDSALKYGQVACEYILKNTKHRCAKFTYLSGQDPQSQKEYTIEGKCADEWMPILLVLQAQTNRGQTEALNSFRNEVVKTNVKLINENNRSRQSRSIGN